MLLHCMLNFCDRRDVARQMENGMAGAVVHLTADRLPVVDHRGGVADGRKAAFRWSRRLPVVDHRGGVADGRKAAFRRSRRLPMEDYVHHHHHVVGDLDVGLFFELERSPSDRRPESRCSRPVPTSSAMYTIDGMFNYTQLSKWSALIYRLIITTFIDTDGGAFVLNTAVLICHI